MISQPQSELLELIKRSLFGVTPNLPENVDLAAIYAEARAQTVIALVPPALPEDLAAKWEEPAAQSIAHYMRTLLEQKLLLKLLESKQIPLVILKGTAAAVYYPKPQYRTMGDIDFYVFEEDFETAYGLLVDNGYTFVGDFSGGREYKFTKNEIVFELHRRYSDEEFDIEPVLLNGMKHAVTRSVSGQTFPSLPNDENGILLLDHIRHHLTGGLGLRQIIDWTMFANSILDNDHYEQHFLPLLKLTGLEKFCKIVTKMCKMYLYLPESVTWCDDADTITAEELFEAVMSSGNFGRKKAPYEYNPVTGFIIDARKNGFFKSLQAAGMINFEICKKNKFFRPFAWIFQLFRYMIRGFISLFKGQKVFKDISAGNDKSDFDKRLGI